MQKKIIFSSKTNTAISIGTTYILKWETKSWNFAVIVFLFLMAHQAIIFIQKLKQPAQRNTLNVESIRNSCPNNGGMMQKMDGSFHCLIFEHLSLSS